MENNQLTVIDENGNETLCNILFTFESEINHRNIVIFYPASSESDDEDGIELSAAYYTEDNENGQLEEITEEEVWDEIEDAVSQFEEECCGCDCEDDECCDHNHEGCCHHHE